MMNMRSPYVLVAGTAGGLLVLVAELGDGNRGGAPKNRDWDGERRAVAAENVDVANEVTDEAGALLGLLGGRVAARDLVPAVVVARALSDGLLDVRALGAGGLGRGSRRRGSEGGKGQSDGLDGVHFDCG